MNILLVQRCLECKLLLQCKLAKDIAMRIKLITNTTMKLYNQYEGSKQTPPGGGTLQTQLHPHG
jgi:hypothetical protein